MGHHAEHVFQSRFAGTRSAFDVPVAARHAFDQTASQPSGAVLPRNSGRRLPSGADEIGCLAAERIVLWVTLGVEGGFESARVLEIEKVDEEYPRSDSGQDGQWHP